MRIADRDVRRLLAAPVDPHHWRALARMRTTFEDPGSALARYVTNGGTYPWRTTLRTPLGPRTLTLADRHDLLTVNEIFCRCDYGCGPRGTVVDIGANVGFATLFFLTRTETACVWAFEPDPANVARLRENLRGFESRYRLKANAVTVQDVRTVRFVPAGRYGHIARNDEIGIEVPAITIADALREVAAVAGPIDLVKIDTEGTEESLAAAVPGDVPVREIRYENNRGGITSIVR